MKNICVVSSSRADYGLLYWPLKKINEFMSFGKMPIANGFLERENFEKEFFFI